MSMTDTLQKDRFWQRVRALLGDTNAGRRHAGTAALGGFGKRSFAGRPLEEELQRAWQVAAERNVSLCIIAIEIDCFSEYLAAYGRDAAEDCLETLELEVATLLKQEEHRCMRSGQSGIVLVLPDMPVTMARDLVARINKAVRNLGLVNKESHAGAVTIGAGIAVTNPVPPYDRAVLDLCRQAVRRAQRHGLSRLDIVDLREPRLTQAA
jgi:diguanylate cyclase (GGDEF)-like protein